MQTSILIIYTGGTIGMKQDPASGLLKPFDFNQILSEVPELAKFGCHLDTYSFQPLIDSSDVRPEFWIHLAHFIRDRYDDYDGFVILHGTDTMAYSASMLSFMLEGLTKCIVLTGSQLPIGMLRTDGRENFISAIEIAAARDAEGHSLVPEVCIYFENKLMRGNRTTKFHADNFAAFSSPNYPALAEVGIHIRYNESAIRRPADWSQKLKLHDKLDANVGLLKIFPGMTEQYVKSVLHTEGLRAVVLETFGAGNAPALPWFLDAIRECTEAGIPVVNVTQCRAGSVNMGTYANGAVLDACHVISGGDMMTEAALTKLFVLLGESSDPKVIAEKFGESFCGEISLK